jgi:hypothetical protein
MLQRRIVDGFGSSGPPSSRAQVPIQQRDYDGALLDFDFQNEPQS